MWGGGWGDCDGGRTLPVTTTQKRKKKEKVPADFIQVYITLTMKTHVHRLFEHGPIVLSASQTPP